MTPSMLLHVFYEFSLVSLDSRDFRNYAKL